jgi:hypothetical protein
MRRFVCAATCALLLGGCAKTYIIVSYDAAVARGRENKQGEVFATPKYGELRGSIKTVAVRAPDKCLEDSVGRRTGDARVDTDSRESRKVMSTACGVVLSEMERSLAEAGFRVISWDILYKAERINGVTTYAAALKLGADAVFMINDLQNEPITTDQSDAEHFVYFESDPEGRQVRPAKLGEADRRTIKGLAATRIGSKTGTQTVALGASLDVSAVKPDSGEAFWFYRNSVTGAAAAGRSSRLLLRGRSPDWRPVKPVGYVPDEAAMDPEYRSEETIVRHTEGAGDRIQKMQFVLSQGVIKDFIAQFTGRSAGAFSAR